MGSKKKAKIAMEDLMMNRNLDQNNSVQDNGQNNSVQSNAQNNTQDNVQGYAQSNMQDPAARDDHWWVSANIRDMKDIWQGIFPKYEGSEFDYQKKRHKIKEIANEIEALSAIPYPIALIVLKVCMMIAEGKIERSDISDEELPYLISYVTGIRKSIVKKVLSTYDSIFIFNMRACQDSQR